MLMIGRIVRPAWGMSKHRKLMPCCALPPEAVRTRQNMRLAYCAWVVQILVPLMT
ncbi:hypothetical protein D3C72_2140930 [compost metagenome]